MAYTTAQLVTAYTNANLGKAPDAATTLTLDAYATQSQTGGITDATALTNTLKLVNSTTAVAVETYQFFTNAAPSAAGLAYLVNSTTNATDLNDAYYSKFAQENRFINFSINLATGSGAGATAFASNYGSVTVQQAVASAYDKIIGNAAAQAAGVDPAAAVAYLTRADNVNYLNAFVKANTGLTAAADIDLAVKAALIGQILNAATVSGIGGYAKATAALINDLSDGVLSTDNAAGVNILTAYPGAGAVGQSFALTAGIDTLVGTAGNDTFVGSSSAGASLLSTLDSIDGGAGNDTLTFAIVGNLDTTTAASTTVKNVETVNILATGTVTADSSSWAGTTALNVNGAVGAASATAASSTAVSVVTAQTTGAVVVNGGSSATVTASGLDNAGGGSSGSVNVGGGTAVAGNITVTAAVAANKNAGTVAATTKGGASISLTETLGTGSAGGALNATDGAAAAGKLGTLSTVILSGYGLGSTVTSNALTSLTLANGNANVAVTNNFGSGNATTTLALAVNNVSTGLIDTNNAYSTVNVTTSGKASTLGLSGSNIKTLSVAGDQVLSLFPASPIATFSESGTGSVVATFGNTLKTYTSTATGGDTVTLNTTALTSATFGAGNDVVTLSTAAGPSTTVDLGNGDNKLILAAAPTAGVTLKAGSGVNDALSISDANWATLASTFVAADIAKITGFEILSISDSGSFNGKTYNLGVLPSLTGLTLETGVATGGNDTVTNFVSGSTLTLAGNLATNNGGVVVNVTGAAAGTNDTVNVVANTTITQNNDATVDTTAATVAVTVDNVENVTFKSTGKLSTAVTTGNKTDVALNTLSIAATDTALKTVAITGDQAASFTSNAAFTALTSVNGSGNTAGVSIDVSAATSTSPAIVVTGSAANDTITIGNKAVVAGNGGNDTFVLAAPSSGNSYSTIVDANKGDIITNANAASFGATAITLAGTAVFQDFLDNAAAGNATNKVSWFQYGGDTYIVQDVAAGATFQNGSDIVVKLTGLVDLSKATFSAGAHTLTLG
ncbi:S-layer protein [uncultured Caulobacter sp.]|uniref:S-layer protein n=1 Tax=uncultured Caulobacter sp. TaxID=158749 RepID=UPI0026179B0C|nr:S-layer protein [uncultured Caulobacter sp.]